MAAARKGVNLLLSAIHTKERCRNRANLPKINNRLRYGVSRGYHLGIGLKIPLRRNHGYEFLGQIDVCPFQGAGLNQTQT